MGESDEDDKEFGVSRKIMVAAIFSLFAVVMLIILLHLYSRYLQRLQERRRRAAIHRLRRQIAPEIANFSVEQPKVGLDPLVIASIPAFKYNQTDQLGHDEALECSVCLSTVVEDAMVRLLPNCKHMFHVECIDMWLGSHTTCPICRAVAEPMIQPSAPPLQEGNTLPSVPEMEKGSASSGSRFGSFRWMVSRDRSSRARSCGEEISVQDLERQ
ncbi:ring finger protein, putative [Ricinus communis]|uniref:RING-type E3 ubiquitin transferase n=1 Tax=Ricinus communis TaxID=3988 RepID=B9S962_RICCO|nr:ring finger protein, putative [Ricinus communis]|eukprot:XP_002522531.1 E3 ubiquitin-protein ligase ATL41 [Ricinus communis]